MTNILIASPILSDLSEIIVSDEEENFPFSNLQTIQLYDKWRTTIISNPIIIDIDLSNNSNISYNLISLLGTNASQTSTYRIVIADSQVELDTSPVYDSGTLSLWPSDLSDWTSVNLVHYLETSYNNDWVRIVVTDTSNSLGYFEAGRLYISDAWVPSINIGYGWSIQWVDNSIIDKSLGNNSFIYQKPKYRVLEFELKFITEDEMFLNGAKLDRLRGSSKDILVIQDVSNLDRLQELTVYGLSTELSPIINNIFHYYSKRYKIEELI